MWQFDFDKENDKLVKCPPVQHTGISSHYLNPSAYLDVVVQVHECSFAVAWVDAQGELHLLIQHYKDSHSLLLWTNDTNKYSTYLFHIFFQLKYITNPY